MSRLSQRSPAGNSWTSSEKRTRFLRGGLSAMVPERDRGICCVTAWLCCPPAVPQSCTSGCSKPSATTGRVACSCMSSYYPDRLGIQSLSIHEVLYANTSLFCTGLLLTTPDMWHHHTRSRLRCHHCGLVHVSLALVLQQMIQPRPLRLRHAAQNLDGQKVRHVPGKAGQTAG